MKISVTITKSKYNIIETLKKLNNTDADFLHLDVMDGMFVPNTLFPYQEVKEFIGYNKKPLDIHLMVVDVKKHVDEFININPEYITFHLEVNDDIDELIKYIHSYNIKVGISIKPNTKIEEIKKYLPYIEQVLVMSVEPGLGGQKFIEEVLPKIKLLKTIKDDNNYNYLISVDGGINEETAKLLNDADILSVGSYVCMNDSYQDQINKLRPE
ncbi:MAG: ribulose-phosphate 3-epimerase [Bacilli bacterium]|nr:ribulose-phosphate 3-epimerase [Bacilli bacterium]MDD3895510.1 ribulose-phosphate 3-epimerase [Bacilli bacterium]MDD4407564.1 ribulose-phosphate 3-epimerase [Bacilli bacterium]